MNLQKIKLASNSSPNLHLEEERLSKASRSPYVRALTLAVIRSIRSKKLVNVREIVHSDLVPKFSEHVVQASMGEKIIPPRRPVFVPKVIPKNFAPSEDVDKYNERAKFFPARNALIASSIINTTKVPTQTLPPTQDYGKINNLLNDPSVSSIECAGPSKKIMIIRLGQKQTTNIELTPAEIKEILDKIADKAHVPLSEGVFRAAVDNFSINAVVSEIVGSKFIIKKNTPYSILEKN